MPKFRKPKLPLCPHVEDIRGTIRDLAEKIRIARLKYLEACFKASIHLNGKALATFIRKVAKVTTKNGLYSPRTPISQSTWSVARWFGYFEVGSSYHHRMRWWDHRGLTPEIIASMRGRYRSKPLEAIA